MDAKTMEYMGSRVDEGRKIQQAIKSLNADKKLLEEKQFNSVTFRGREDVYFSDASLVFTEIKNAAIDIIENHIQKLETKFDEL
jgi:hypothetical protein